MNIVIAGGGSIGFISAQYFMREGHDVTVVEQDPVIASQLAERLDVTVVTGQASDSGVLAEANLKSAALFLALTDVDEVNVIACALARELGVPRRVARLGNSVNPDRASEKSLGALGVDDIINPEEILYDELNALCAFPGASDLKYFLGDDYAVSVFTFDRQSPHYGKKFKEIKINCPIEPLAFAQMGKFAPFDPNVIVNEFLYVYFGCEKKHLRKLHQSLFPHARKIERIMIYHSGYRSTRPVSKLIKSLQTIVPGNITLVVDDQSEATKLSAAISAPVIFGDPAKPFFSQQENLQDFDALIALSANYERNLFAAAIAYQTGVPYTISLVRYPEHVNLASIIPLTSILNPALAAANRIMRYHKMETIISRTILSYEQAEVLELLVTDKSPLAGAKASSFKFQNSRFMVVKRGPKFMAVTSSFVFKPNDRVLFWLFEAEKDLLTQII